jgi:formate dehydrogenase subunit gamma
MDIAKIESIVESHRVLAGATLPILHEIQAAYGYIPPEAIPVIAEGLNLSRAEIHGVVTFYADFHTQPRGRHIVQVCRGEACQAKGSGKLEDHAKSKLGCDFHETTVDNFATLEPVYCLGNCGCSPSLRIGDEVYGRVDEDRFDELLSELRQGAEE